VLYRLEYVVVQQFALIDELIEGYAIFKGVVCPAYKLHSELTKFPIQREKKCREGEKKVTFGSYKSGFCGNKSDISYLKTSRAFDVQIHSRALLAAVVCWLATL